MLSNQVSSFLNVTAKAARFLRKLQALPSKSESSHNTTRREPLTRERTPWQRTKRVSERGLRTATGNAVMRARAHERACCLMVMNGITMHGGSHVRSTIPFPQLQRFLANKNVSLAISIAASTTACPQARHRQFQSCFHPHSSYAITVFKQSVFTSFRLHSKYPFFKTTSAAS